MRKISQRPCVACRDGFHGACDLTFLNNLFPNIKVYGGESICICKWSHNDKEEDLKEEKISERKM